MNKYNTIMGQMLEEIPRSQFEKLVKEYGTEHGAKGFRSWVQFIAMLYAQLSGQHGLRSLVNGMNSQKNSWYHMGINDVEREISRSTLSYANTNRDSDLFKELFEYLLNKAQTLGGEHGFKFKNKLYSIDETIIDLCLKLFPWAEFRENKGGIKLTVKLDHQGKIPCFVVMSNAKEHDSKKIWEVPREAGDVLVFDRGYADYGHFKALCDEKVWFVTRLKKNAKFRRIKKREIKAGENIISDYEIIMPSLSEDIVLRKIIAVDSETKKKITILTNNLQWSPVTVASVYKDRWQIELFFKEIKQNLSIKKFYGNSKNAVMTQIWIALIVLLLFKIIKAKLKHCEYSFTNFISIIKTMLFQRISLNDFLSGIRPPPEIKKIVSLNYELAW